MENRKQFTFYRSYYDAVKILPKKEQVAVLLAVCGYALDGEEPQLQGTASAIFSLIRPTLDSSRRKAESGKQGGSKGQANGKQSESKTEANCKQTAREKEKEEEKEKEVEYECTPPTPSSRSVFTPPTVDEVKEYCDSRGNGIDAQAFVDFYASKGWMIGKNKMKDWKASVRTWERDTRRVQQQRRNKHEVSAHPETQNQRDGADWMLKYMKGGE